MTKLWINVRVEGQWENESGPLGVIKQKVEYTRIDGERIEKEVKTAGDIVFDTPLAKEPVGVYLMLKGTASRIQFVVTSPYGEQTKEWIR